MRKTIYIALAVYLLSLAAASEDRACTKDYSNEKLGSHIVVEACESAGTFSIGGLHQGTWEKLTYFYPKPWSGTYATVNVDGKYYATSDHPRDGISMDAYLTASPAISGSTITLVWSLPENIIVSEKFTVVENGTKIQVTVENKDSTSHNIGVRLHLDTMIGLNDGAPIYIPGDGLKTTEKEYSGSNLNFRYWKAYNRQDSPTIVATGIINPDEALTYPSTIVIADWKKSKDHAWDYQVSQERSILGDSAVILYYNTINVSAGQTYSISTKYGSGNPVLPKEKGVFGITEVTQDNVYGKYCGSQTINLSVDLVSSASENSGLATITVYEDGRIIFTQSKATGQVPEDSYKKIEYQFNLPDTADEKSYNVIVRLTDESGNELDKVTRTSFIKIKPQECKSLPKPNLGLIFIILFLVALITAIAFAAFHFIRRMGKVVISKTVNEKGKVNVKVENNTHEDLVNCVVEDRIPSQAEIKVSTLHVARRDNKLIWKIGKLKSKDAAKLEYTIKGVNVLPPCRVIWDKGEEISD